ncbi:tyrosine-type recombinase/integrase [Kribbella sp. VKM Ac-2568]|uniref:tyrosine-type recombinase/integrase n=1 Tax=Kribbella sp. VKM Ac-2568 TaxID=2512219 RepID=UPI0010EE3D91|nr:tyrosine-type recombinase/integrase [Kribbella sp. VKM Ac-2568]TCM43651.1 site-specific recombinase XerD [Kribbella sp. VKM Ac-2568]
MGNKPGHRQFGNVRRRESGRWQASYLGPDGIRRFAPSTFPDETSAGRWLTLREADLIRGEWNDPDLGRISFGNFGASWVDEHELSPRTRELYKALLRLHIDPFLGKKELAKIGPETVRKWRKDLQDADRSADTVAKAYRLVRAIMTTAVDDERIKRNPCRIKGADTAARAERPVASVKQVYALAEAIGPRFRVFVLAAALTGLRWGELIALRRVDIDLDDATISVHRSFAELSGGRLVAKRPKSAAGIRTVPIPAVLVEELRVHLVKYVEPHAESLVFTGERGGTPKRGSWRSTVKWTAKVKEAGLPAGFHFHDLRHTGNHLASRSGASTRELMHRMGHGSMRAALIYQHHTDARAREIAAALNEVVARENKPGDDEGGTGLPALAR